MNCFSHTVSPAVASCKSCGRGVCQECARDIGHAVVCSGTCETQASELHEMNRRALRIYGIGTDRKRTPVATIMWAAFALLFTGWGVVRYFEYGKADWFLILFGLISGAIAWISYRRARELELNC